jgi:hypothetical protein
MRSVLFLICFSVVTMFVAMSATSAFAQASRTWVSGVGDDANPCSRTAPCKTFAGAISKTAVLGEINCLDPGGFGAVTITKSITIDCHELFASVLNAGTNGVIINFNSFTDARKTVRIRNINFNGFDTGIGGIRIIGAAGSAGSEVFIEDVLIDGNFGGTARGISDERTGGGELSISDTTVRNTGATGIAIFGGSRLDAIIDNVRVQNSNFGVAIGTAVRLMINRSVFSGNVAAGIEADAGGEIMVDNSVTSSNGIGVQAQGTIRLANTDIAFNGTGIQGATQSFGNNRIVGNTVPGIAPTLLGATSNPFGQQ